ncbi:MAG: phenylacetate--CoA ligase, partial [Clostridia bacterium]|nr:phenylacetate--CoA ligase [Clostridia bacterium]
MDLIWNKSAETMKRAEIEKLQLERLKHIVKYCYENVPFYTKKLDEAGVKPEMIKTLEDIKLIPFTTKEDLRDNYPFGMLAVPQNKIVRIHASSGTTGNPTVVGYTQNDLDVWT